MDYLIHHMIDRQAAACPAHCALTCVDQTMTYGELAAASNRLANALVAHGVAAHDRVGIYMEKGLDSVVAMYAIMKAGAAYVPLDPSAPVARVAGVIEDCAIRCLVSAPAKRRALRALHTHGVELDLLVGVDDDQSGWSVLSQAAIDRADAGAPPRRKILADDLAYIIYTSGSTGTPKGIMHSHASGLSFARWAASEYALKNTDRLSNHAPLHFDLSILDYFAGAVAGATTVIIPEEYTKLPASYAQLLESQRVSVLYTVPFALIQLLLRGGLEERDLSALRWIIFGGEPFVPVHLHALRARLPWVLFDNIYGPAEVNGVTHYTVGAQLSPDAAIPIGPVACTAQGLIVDDNDCAVAPGTAGELLIRSPTMMLGYWNRPQLNARVFWRRKNAAGLEEVYFRTGDVVRADADGTLHFVGRRDRQVKIRGYRVELDEVELALASHAGVEEAAAFAVADADGTQNIHGQVTLTEAATTPAELIKHLKSRLPGYAMPAKVTITDAFVRTSTGKIDRRRLALTAMETR